MKKVILFLGMFTCSLSVFAGPSRVYLFDGFFVHLSVPSFNEATEKIQKHLETNHPGVVFTAIHNSFWQSVCDDLKGLTGANKPDRIVLIGHSYGGNATMDISRCLGSETVDMVITLDDFQKFFTGPADTAPDNANVVYNFYENQDIALRGIQNVHRPDNSTRNITNTHVELQPSVSPHYEIVTELVNNGVIQKLLDQAL